MSVISTVIFDMYETLVPNEEKSWIALFGEICRTQGLVIKPEELYKEWKSREVGFRRSRLNIDEPYKSPPFKSYEEAWRGCFVDVFTYLGLAGDADAAARAAIHSMSLKDPFEEVPETMSVIQRRWATAILSNADDNYLLPLLDRLNMRFEVVLSSEMVRAYKPHPLPFRCVLEKLGLEPRNAVYVGDNPFDDVLGAQSVGMWTVWVNRYGKTLDDGAPTPDGEIDSLAKLPQILERWD